MMLAYETKSAAARVLLGAVVIATVCGCTVGPDFTSPAPPGVDRYTREPLAPSTVVAQGKSQRFMSGAPVPEAWWRLFGSPELDGTVRQALSNSPTVAAALASLRESQDNLRAGYGVFFPQVGAQGQAVREQTPPMPAAGRLQEGSVFNLVTASGSVTYLLDFSGGKRRSVEALRAQSDYRRYLAMATYLTLSTNVVNTVIAYAAYAAEANAIGRMIALQTQQLQAIEAQVRAGTSSYSTVLSLQGLIAGNRAAMVQLEQKMSQSAHLLATLQGRSPAEADAPRIALAALALPDDLPVSLPSDLVRQRPDILAAQAQLHAASANIGVATAAMFPSISLSGTYGKDATRFAGLSGDGFRFWSIGPSISIPVFEGWSLWYGRKAAIDAFDQAQASYRQTVLAAFAQVADVLDALAHDAQALQAQEGALNDARTALDLVQVNFRAGMAGYLDVLAADVQFQQASMAYLGSVAQRQQDTVALFAALGGGWRETANAEQGRQ
ncbi:MAG: efflux transporter outer membrane subunit [Bordetella sp.]|uniref:efflux transporter outer membrane subunit n=1 Tax=Bordetella sp. TaxID=28081 RepID=UPI003F7BEB50